jgi:hypothetical protein
MIEKESAGSAQGKPRARAATASRVKATVTASRSGAAGGKRAVSEGRKDEMRDRIQRRAYELWESEGRPAGREHAHWLQAESEVSRARGLDVGVSR